MTGARIIRVGTWLGLAVVAMGSITPADAVRRRDQENPIQGAPEDEPFKESSIAPPQYPKDSDLIEFELRGESDNRFFIDGATLSVGPDKIVRFVMVVRSDAEAANVSFSALRCKTKEWKDYAFGKRDGSWMTDQSSQWQRIERKRYNNYQYTLYRDFLCDSGVVSSSPAGSAKKIVKSLRYPQVEDNRVPRKE